MELNPQESIAAAFFARAFGLSESSLVLIHRGEGIVLEASRNGLPLILKMNASDQDITGSLQAQFHWVHTLHANGLVVPDPVESVHSQWIEHFELENRFYTAFIYHRIPITKESQIDWKDPNLPVLVGEMLGKMHRLARIYQPPAGAAEFDEGDAASWLTHPEENLHPSQAALLEPIASLRRVLTGFPRTRKHYGLIHDDFHTGNVFNLSGQIAVIDFGCCHRSWFAKDLSSALLFCVWIGPKKETLKDEAAVFIRKLVQGYRRQADFREDWCEMFPALLKLRELSLYQSFYRQVDRTYPEPDGLFSYLYSSIRDNRPFLDLDYEALVHNSH
jgi:Ser/Thr protein kinase RdoA (MazF antagonist)